MRGIFGRRLIRPAIGASFFLAALLLGLATQSSAFAADGHGWIRFAGDYDKLNLNHSRSGISNTTSLQVSNPEDNSARRPNAFQAAEDLVFDRLVFTQWHLPLAGGDPALSNDGDQCLYAKSPDVDPGPSELFCIPTYTTRVAPLPGIDPEATGYRGVTHVVELPEDVGLFFPKGAIFTCPSHLKPALGGRFSEEQLGRARWSCRIEYHVARPGEMVGRIARIPFLDAMLEPDPDGELFDSAMVWMRGWEAPQPLVVKGFLVYASTLGLRPGSDKTRNYRHVCLKQIDAVSRNVLRSVCVPNFGYASDRNAPNGDTPSGFFKLAEPIALSAGQRLTASCRTAENARTDCAFFVLYEVPPDKRIPTVGDYYWDLGQFDQALIADGGPYCTADRLKMLTPAGKEVLRIVARYHDGQWAGTNCAEGDFACACHALYKRFENGSGN